VAAIPTLNTIILSHFPAEEAVSPQIFNYFASHVIEVNQIVVTARFTTER